MSIEIKELTKYDLKPGLLETFNRFQEVNKVWRKEEGQYVLKDNPFTEQWDENLKNEVIAEDFTHCINTGGAVIAAFDGDKLIAFAAVLRDFFGNEKQYVQLMQLHTSYEYRSRGIGKELFDTCAIKARQWGAKKLYISSHSADETQKFYRGIGCVDALEINKRLAEHEPCDCQLEYVL